MNMPVVVTINCVPFSICDPIDVCKLEEAEFKKPNLIWALVIGARPKRPVYFTKNCHVSFFDDKFVLIPNLIDPQMMCATSAFLYYREGLLHTIKLQQFGNDFESEMSVELFRKEARSHIGEPTTSTSMFEVWRDSSSALVSWSFLPRKQACIEWSSIS